MALTKRYPSEARPNGRSAPKGKVMGKTPNHPGHPVRGKGRSAPKGGAVRSNVKSNNSPSLKGRGRTSLSASNYGKSGSY